MRKPELADFGLESIDIERVKAAAERVEGNLETYVKRSVFTLVVLGLLAYNINLEDNISMLGVLAMAAVISLLTLIVIDPVTALMLTSLEWTFGLTKKIRTIKYPQYEDILQFEKLSLEYENHIKRHNELFWWSLDGWEFEKEFAELLNRLGMNVRVTSGSNDQGIDIVVESPDKIVIQCKAHKKPVGPAVIRETFGAMHAFGANEAWLVNLGGFTQGVYSFAHSKPIRLLDLQDVMALNMRASD